MKESRSGNATGVTRKGAFGALQLFSTSVHGPSEPVAVPGAGAVWQGAVWSEHPSGGASETAHEPPGFS